MIQVQFVLLKIQYNIHVQNTLRYVTISYVIKLKNVILLYLFFPTENQLADIFTKPLSLNRFAYICMELGMLNDFA